MGAVATTPVLEVRGLVKAFPGVKALEGVDFDVRAGERLLIWTNRRRSSTRARIETLFEVVRRLTAAGFEIDLVEEDGKMTVRLTHHGLPPEAVDDHERGWSCFLGVLPDALGPADE